MMMKTTTVKHVALAVAIVATCCCRMAAADVQALPMAADLPVTFGADSHGENRLEGRFLDTRIYSRAWSDAEAKAYPATPAAADGLVWSGVPSVGETCAPMKNADFSHGFTFACRVVLEKVGGRLLDNATPGGHDGWLIDTWPASPRVFAPHKFHAAHSRRFKTGRPQCLVVTVAADGKIGIWLDGHKNGLDESTLQQRYTPIDGGYEIANGGARFNRALYGWHGNDWRRVPRFFAMASDRPEVIMMAYPGRQPIGELSFGDGSENVVFRYVRGRAEYNLKDKGSVRMARAATSDDLLVEVTGAIPFESDGEWTLRASECTDGKSYYAFARKGCKDPVPSGLAAMFMAACGRLDALSRDIAVSTPDKALDSLVASAGIAMDAAREGDGICSGVDTWRDPFPGWRVAYGVTALGRDETLKAYVRFHLKWQTGNGRVICNAGHDGIYNFNEEFADAILRHWLRSGDDAFMRDYAYDGVKRHLEWMDANMRVPGTSLYENWLNAWNTDNKWCNGGAGTIASAYVFFACRVMARAAERLGKPEDAALFRRRAGEIAAAIDRSLWSERDGIWGEYRERYGLGRLVTSPDSSVIYTAIDSGLADADSGRARRALAWYERNVPSEVTPDGIPVIYSSNKLPRYYSSCGLYPNENLHLALAYWQTGETEMAWRHFHSAWFQSVRGPWAGPGSLYHIHRPGSLENSGDLDFTDTVSMFLRDVVEGLFGIVIDAPAGKVAITPGFPLHWNKAEIKTPYFGYGWTRSGGVAVTHNPGNLKVELHAASPKLVGDAMPKPHSHWGASKGEGCNLSLPAGAKFRFVDLAPGANQDLRTLHDRNYTPMHGRFPWVTWGPSRTVMANGRSWWEARARGRYAVPDKLRIPADGILRSSAGIPFKIGPANAPNSLFASFYDQLPAKAYVPLSGKASGIAMLAAVSTNPNVAWMESARVEVEYADGSTAPLSLVPPDNCDDWLNYALPTPYHINGEHIMLHDRAHVNVLALKLDPTKELKRLSIECRSTETLAGIVAATLIADGSGK